MTGHDYNRMAIGQIPHGLIIQKVPPSIWLPLMVVIWACLTMLSASVKTVTQMCVVRFFAGLAEASTHAGTIYIIGSWYKPAEMTKRTAIFTAAGQVGTMFAGVMMAAIYKGINGLGGLGDWQRVFLIDGIITLQIAIFGFLYFHDIPGNTKVAYLNPLEKILAVSRLAPIKEGGHSIRPVSLMRRLVLSSAFWILLFWSPMCATLAAWASKHSTKDQINTYPLGVHAVGIVVNMISTWHMDVTGSIPMAVVAVVVIILQRSGDDAVRSVTVYCMNIGSMTLHPFWSPCWRKGCNAMIVCCFSMLRYIVLTISQLDKQTLEKFSHPSKQDAEAVIAVREKEYGTGQPVNCDRLKNTMAEKVIAI
ncbi:MFS general substrate transporter [Colletotrichum falcatum]|nr:MFS general substrate transporter [Colletotrichum falcatum]